MFDDYYDYDYDSSKVYDADENSGIRRISLNALEQRLSNMLEQYCDLAISSMS
jgi:hypothetical protein